MPGLFCAEKIMKKIIINGEIGYEITTQGVRAELDAAAGEDLDVQIASPGGYVSTGINIYNLFRDYKREHPQAQIVATIKGVAASMATYLAVNPAFDLVAAEDNAVFMIHNAWGGVIGDYREMERMAKTLSGFTLMLGRAYAAKSGTALEKIRTMMDDETWLFGDEIKAAGFVDEIIKSEDDGDKESALAQAHIKFDALAAHMAEKREDIKQIAALITDETATAHNPAPNAGKNTMEVQPMTLSEFLSQNPAAKAEYDAALSAKFNAGKVEGENAVKARIAKAAPYLMADCKYPNQIKDLAVGVIKGEKSTEGLETAVAVYDALAEKSNSEAAATESAATAAASGQQPPAEPSKDGVIRGEADMEAAIADAKKSLGMEVK